MLTIETKDQASPLRKRRGKIQNRFGQLFGSKETAIENLHDFKTGRFASSAAIELLEITNVFLNKILSKRRENKR
jgi:hypothetical protein